MHKNFQLLTLTAFLKEGFLIEAIVSTQSLFSSGREGKIQVEISVRRS